MKYYAPQTEGNPTMCDNTDETSKPYATCREVWHRKTNTSWCHLYAESFWKQKLNSEKQLCYGYKRLRDGEREDTDENV